MNRYPPLAILLLLTITITPALSASPVTDLRKAVPADAYLITHLQHNPERDYQRVHAQRVIETISEANFVERIVAAVTANMDEDESDQVLKWLEAFKTATAPIDLQALLDTQQAIYAQRWEPFQVVNHHGKSVKMATTQHLVLLCLPPAAAQGYQEGVTNLFQVLEDCAEGEATVNTEKHGSTTLTTLSLPDDAPFTFAVARVDDVVLMSSSSEFAGESLAMLLGNGHPSKFDDPRLAQALKQLPAAEDAVVFLDGKEHFANIRKLIDMVRQQAGDNPQADRWLNLVNTIFDELAILDYLAVVEYTDGHRNIVETMGKLLPDAEHRLLTEMLASGEPFEDWQSWVPADATGYALSMGVNLHPLYRHAVDFIQEHIPEMHQPLANFEAWQRQVDLDLDVDLFQSFSGESVTVTLPSDRDSSWCDTDFVWATRCHKPARVAWLVERLIDQLNENPFFKMQELELIESEELDGFQEVSATMLELFDIHPLIGFADGWMFVGTSPESIQKVLDTRAGESASIASTPEFQEFQLQHDGPVRSVMFVDIAKQTQQISKALRQAGLVLPMIISMAEAQVETEEDLAELIPLRVVSELLASVGEVIGEFDFMESQLKTVQDGKEPGTWREKSVTLIRPADEDSEEP